MAVFVMIVVKILKPILTWKLLFCVLEFSLQALFLLHSVPKRNKV
ncbi:hypothetical protein QFZ31_004521 [Neobacillus niacini]|nr:hypothetical protein [Neobacillus niacini]